MARPPKKFTIVRAVNGGLEISTYGSPEAAREALAHAEGVDGHGVGDGSPLAVFGGEPIPFTVKRTPTVTLGEQRARKPRSSGGKPGRPRKPKPTPVDETFFEGNGNGSPAAASGGVAPTATE